MSSLEPMNAPNLLLNRDGVDYNTATIATDIDNTVDYFAEAIRPSHEDASRTQSTSISFSPYTNPEDVRYELRKAKPVPPKEVKAEGDGIISSAVESVKGVAHSITGAINGASDWARERLNGAPHSHELPKATPAAPAPLHTEAGKPIIALKDDPHQHSDMYDAAGHRHFGERHGTLEEVKDTVKEVLLSVEDSLERAVHKTERATVESKEKAEGRLDAAGHEFRHSRMGLGNQAHVTTAQAKALPIVRVSEDHVVEQLTAPSLGADIDMSDGLAEAGDALGRGLLGLVGMRQERGATIHTTTRKSLPGAMA